ncbi:MAG: AAA family ATPase, partial [Deltaproteobacteria bacterium]|nr:AAA family ATPase [Deltaproteobacteria bacterium]
LEGERKLVTVLFADCVGFTALASKLDPERLHDVMDGCFERVLEAVHRYEGTVNQFTGDGVMALFGAPIAHEDHAVRAVAAALETQRALAGYAAELRRTRGLEFGLRIGLNTGPVVVGKIGDDLRMDYTAQGETVNLAARLQQAGGPGTVSIGEATWRAAGRYFVTEDRGEISLKGFDRPVRAFVVTGERARRARFDVAVERGLTRLAGRDLEAKFLLDCFERARGGRGQVVSVVGDAGVGKSRLVHELRRNLAGTDCRILGAGGLPHGEAAPFRLIVAFLRAILAIEEGEPEPAQIEKVASRVAELDPGLAWTVPYVKLLLALPAPELEAQGLDAAQRKGRTLEAVRGLVVRAADDRPQVLLVEDLQWVDPSSEEALRSVIDALAERRVLVVCTHRTGYVPSWHGRTFYQRLALEPLSMEESARMAETLLPGAEEAALRELVIARAEGNPFFIEELAGYLRERGDEARLAEAAIERGVPETITDLLSARIDRLREPLKRTLQRASVLGREFPLRLLEAMAPPGEDVRGHVAELVALELVHEKELFPEPRLAFTQPLIRDVAYRGLLLRARAELHELAGAALERLWGGRVDEVLQDLARHYAQSGNHAKALHYLRRAGDRAASLFAFEEAAALYAEALALADAHAALAAERGPVLERLGDVAFARGQIQAALERWSAALGAASGGAATAVADLHRKIGVARWAAGQTERALAELEEGLAALGPNRRDPSAARLYQELGRIHFRLGDNRRATEWASQALALGEALDAADVVSHAYNTLGVARARGGDLEGGASTVQKSLETALAHGLGALACRAYTNLAVMYAALDHRRSAEYCREGLELARRIGDQLQQSWLYCAMAGGHCTLAGDYDEGVKAAEAAIDLDRRLGQRSHLPIPIVILAQIYQCRGDQARSAEHYREALALAEEIGEPQLLFPCYDGLATLAIEAGDDVEAERWLGRSRELQGTAGWSSDSFLVMPFLC